MSFQLVFCMFTRPGSSSGCMRISPMVVEWIGRKSDGDLMWRFKQHEMGAIDPLRNMAIG